MFIVQIFLIVITIFISFFNPDLYQNASLCMYSYLVVVLIEVYQKKRITLNIVFFIAFLYMIVPEGILYAEELYFEWGKDNVNTGFVFLVFTSCLLFIGYKLHEKFSKRKIRFREILIKEKIIKRRLLLILIIFFNLAFFIINLENALYGIISGRASAFPFVFSSALYAISFILLGISNSLFPGNKLKTILINLPVLLIFFAIGTRYFLVYIAFILFFDKLNTLTFRSVIVLAGGTLFLLLTTGVIKNIRREGLLNLSGSRVEYFQKGENFTEFFAAYGSSEGLIRNMAMINDYTRQHGYTYGKSIGFIGIFWIPRAMWPDKPTMLDNWLIRKYYHTGFSEGHSSASSYGGEFYMDFGFLFAALILFFGGILLSKLQNWIDSNYNSSLKITIFSGFLYGWLFFGVRSILTSSFMLVYFIIFSYLIFKLLNQFNVFNKELVIQRNMIYT